MKKKFNILFICKENSARSQLAEAVSKNTFPNHNFYSAGSEPGIEIKPVIKKYLEEKQIDFSDQYPKSFSELPEIVFDLVIILCQDESNCPLFSGEFKHKLYFPLEDIGQISDDKKAVKVIDDIVNLIDDIIRLFIEDEIVYYTCPVCKLHYENEEDKNECEKWCRTHNNKQNLKIISKSREAKRNFRVF